MGNQTLWTTIVGSNCWGTPDEHSDTDLFTVYVGDNKDIFLGKQFKSTFDHKVNYDLNVHEIGVVCNQLAKGNINFMVGVMSPVVVATSSWHTELKQIISLNPTYKIYDSIHGMAVGNLKKYIYSGLDDTVKRRTQIMRALMFGIEYFKQSTRTHAHFELPVNVAGLTTDTDIETAMTVLDALHDKWKNTCEFDANGIVLGTERFLLEVREWNGKNQDY